MHASHLKIQTYTYLKKHAYTYKHIHIPRTQAQTHYIWKQDMGMKGEDWQIMVRWKCNMTLKDRKSS